MNEIYLKSLLDEIAEKEVPLGIDLWPEIQHRLLIGKPYDLEGVTIRRPARLRPVLVVCLVLFVLCLAFLLFTPQGHTFAQQVVQFFTRTEGHTQPLPEGINHYITPAPAHYLEIILVDPQTSSRTINNLPTYPGCEDPAVVQTYHCQMAAAELLAEFDAQELPSDPTGLAFEMIDVDPEDRSITIYYANGNPSNIDWLSLTQGLGSFPADKFPEVPVDEGEAVQVAGSPGEYVSGAFIYRFESDFSTWMSDPGIIQQLAWQNGNRWFVIQEAITAGHPGYMDRQALITLAESLMDAAPKSEQQKLRPEYLHTLAEAELLARFKIKAPGRLPDGFWYYQTQFTPKLSQIHLMYVSAAGSWLEIFETPAEKFNLQSLISGLSTAEQVEINGNEGWYVNRYERSDIPTFLEGDAYEGLFWQADGIVYRILFSPSSESGDRIGKGGMITIANNLVFPYE